MNFSPRTFLLAFNAPDAPSSSLGEAEQKLRRVLKNLTITAHFSSVFSSIETDRSPLSSPATEFDRRMVFAESKSNSASDFRFN